MCVCVRACVRACVRVLCLQVQVLAQELQSLHFSASHESTRKVASELNAILTGVEAACLAHENGTVGSCTCTHVCIHCTYMMYMCIYIEHYSI